SRDATSYVDASWAFSASARSAPWPSRQRWMTRNGSATRRPGCLSRAAVAPLAVGHVDRRAGPHLQDRRRRRPSSALRGGHYYAHPLPRVQQLEGLGPEACQEARLQAAHAWRWLGKHFLSAP